VRPTHQLRHTGAVPRLALPIEREGERIVGYRRSISAKENPRLVVLTVFTHSNPKPFCLALLDVFTRGQMERGYARGRNFAATGPAAG
jgi:hypothetical protein